MQPPDEVLETSGVHLMRRTCPIVLLYLAGGKDTRIDCYLVQRALEEALLVARAKAQRRIAVGRADVVLFVESAGLWGPGFRTTAQDTVFVDQHACPGGA